MDVVSKIKWTKQFKLFKKYNHKETGILFAVVNF